MGKRGEREKVAEANTHLAKNTMNTRKTHTIQGRLLPNGGHRSDRILARKDRSTCSLKSTSEREEHLEEGLDDLGARNREPKALYNLNALGKIQEVVDNRVPLGRSMRPIDERSTKGCPLVVPVPDPVVPLETKSFWSCLLARLRPVGSSLRT